ncbi:MAG TPA: hypothetical protein VGY53_02785, partial [Isosphaeraceae bacterium]|nr:hypothetical protein [Isosphaeraceae bacterium]
MRFNQRLRDLAKMPLGRVGTCLVGFAVCLAPAWMFADTLQNYRLHSDDFAYLAGSRTLNRALAALFQPHNTHIVPAWRLLTWALVACAGSLSNLQPVFAGAAYGILVAVMLMVGRLVARETGNEVLGLAAMAFTGSTSLMNAAGTWYSASQTLWAGFGILATLWYLQEFRRRGGRWRLLAAAVCTWLAAGFWSIGHAAGPVGAVYLFCDGRAKCKRVAWAPLAATGLAIVLALAVGGRKINATVSFGGRTTVEAAKPLQGAFHTLQAVPEDLIFGNLGLTVATTLGQGAVMTLGLAACWAWSALRRGRPGALECAGGALVVISFFVEWTVRGYLPFFLLRGAVPWYDTIPHIGWVLFVAGWWAGHNAPANSAPSRATVGGALAVLLIQGALIAVNQPRIDALLNKQVPSTIPEELRDVHIP